MKISIDNTSTFLVYDYETFGKHPSLDRPVQFACVRTNHQFYPIEKEKVFYCIPGKDYLPDPEAVLITGITPQKAIHLGIIESEFACKIYELFNKPKTCIVGYNNIFFDDEVTRFLFYRNLYEPYEWSWKNGNSRWDLLNIFRTYYFLRPNGIEWPADLDGNPSFKLEDLTKINSIEHIDAHSAVGDIYALIELVQKIRSINLRLFEYLYFYRNKNTIRQLVNIVDMIPLLHVSNIFKNRKRNISWLLPLGWDPNNSNILILYDLHTSLEIFFDILNNIKINKDKNINVSFFDQKTDFLYPIKFVYINKCPIFLPVNVLRPVDAERIEFDTDLCLKNLKVLRNNKKLINEILNYIFLNCNQNKIKKTVVSNNVDLCLYDGFFGISDRNMMNVIVNTKPDDLSKLCIHFIDKRLEILFFRYKARNFFYLLNNQEQLLWKQYYDQLFNEVRLISYFNNLKYLYIIYYTEYLKRYLLIDLLEYFIFLFPTIINIINIEKNLFF